MWRKKREKERGERERERERGTQADFTLMLVYFYVCGVIHCLSDVLANLGKVYTLSFTALPNPLSP